MSGLVGEAAKGGRAETEWERRSEERAERQGGRRRGELMLGGDTHGGNRLLSSDSKSSFSGTRLSWRRDPEVQGRPGEQEGETGG